MNTFLFQLNPDPELWQPFCAMMTSPKVSPASGEEEEEETFNTDEYLVSYNF